MELTILGTAAAEGWPAPFCRCAFCEEARRRGGPNIRTRSGALIDDDLKIDFCPDTLCQMQRTGRCLDRVRTLVFTHQHSDHVAAQEMEWAVVPYTQTPPAEIHVHANAETLALIEGAFEPKQRDQLTNYRFHPPLQSLVPVTTAAGDVILPMPADHVRGAFVLRITRARDGKTLFYGHDSGLYPEATLAALADGPKLDIALFDCTLGGQKSQNRGHMGIDGVIQMADELRRRGAVTDRTKLVATHFSHNGGLLHEELCAAFLPHGILVAYDGITLRV
jgi:phosphoribosyl 1,2-cyclic phosphate phosphodiesterase